MADKFETWAIMELYGHKRRAGRVTEVTIAGKGMLRIDVPSSQTNREAFTTHIHGPDAIYGIHPCTEDMARLAAAADSAKESYEYDIDDYLAKVNDRALQKRLGDRTGGIVDYPDQ